MSTKIIESVRILLVRPLYPGNVGSVARVMKNLGFRRQGTGPRPVSPEALRGFAEEAEAFLRETGFLTGDMAKDQTALRRLERLLVRASPSRAEMALLWALLRHAERKA